MRAAPLSIHIFCCFGYYSIVAENVNREVGDSERTRRNDPERTRLAPRTDSLHFAKGKM